MKLMLEVEELPSNEFEGFKIVCENRNLAMYTSDELNSIGNLKMPCDIIRIETGHRNSFAMVLSKHNPFTNLINFQLQKFIDYGMINRLKYKSSKKKPCDMIKHQPQLFNEFSRADILGIWSLGENIENYRGYVRLRQHNERRYNLQSLMMKVVILKSSPFVNINKNGELD
uniref:Uncharacterized protein n=1 Tax=Vespula pensylvanica TaxID=30213 RepID=A0A834K199_VESPE|nr:hypothetical protein H0235_016294 [Vespula pensylvanica]